MGFFGMGFGFLGVIYIIIFLLVIGFFIFIFARIIGQKQQNDRSPRLTVSATVVSKRGDVTVHHHDHDGMHHHTSSTTYYATFLGENVPRHGDRMELPVPATEYGLLIEGDEGDLTFQGTRFLSFDRRRSG